MKNLNFKLKGHELLTKDQMKNIVGGYIGCGVTGADGGDLGTVKCTGSGCDCQDVLDQICENDASCANIDCGCK